MSDIQFFETKMGRQFYDVTMPELVRQIHRLNDLLARVVEMQEKQDPSRTDETGHGEED